MKQNTINPSGRFSNSTAVARTRLCKTLSISMLALFAATAVAGVSSKTMGLELEKVTIQGDHVNGDSVAFTYTDLTEKKIVFNKGAASTAFDKPLLEITPVEVSVWHAEDDRLVCNSLAGKKCELTISRNKIGTNLPDACGNYTLMEAWDKYWKLADALEFVIDPALSKEFEKAGRCFDAMQEACKATPLPHCNM